MAHIALRDTLVVAAHIDQLASPESLYALAREECRRRRPVPPADADEPPARPSQPDADSRLMAWNAVTSMDPADAEVLELAYRHDVEPGIVLGVPYLDVRGLLDRARFDLMRALGAEIVVSRASHACPDRAEVLRGWDGTMTAELRDRVLRHAASCRVCGPNLPRNVSAARVFGLLPDISLPPAIRAQVLAFAGDPQTEAYREFAIARAVPRRIQPRPVVGGPGGRTVPQSGVRGVWGADSPPVGGSPGGRPPGKTGKLAAMVTAAAVSVAIAVVVSAIAIEHPGGGRHGPGQPAAGAGQPGGPQERRQGAGAIGALPVGRAQPTSAPAPQPVPLPTASTGVAVFTTLTKPLPGTPSQGPAPLPPRVPGRQVTGPPAPPPRPGQAQGTLTVTPSTLDVGSSSAGKIVLTAQGGPDTWSAGTSSGAITLSGYGGVLRAGQSVTIVVSVNRAANGRGPAGGASIYLDQGTSAAQTIRVLWSGTWPRPPRPTPTPTPPPTPSPSPSSGSPTPTAGSPSASSGSSPPASPPPTPSVTSPPPSPSPRYPRPTRSLSGQGHVGSAGAPWLYSGGHDGCPGGSR